MMGHVEAALHVACDGCLSFCCRQKEIKHGEWQLFRFLFIKTFEVLEQNLLKLTMCALNFQITRLMETWLNKSFSSQFFFPEISTVYRYDRDCHTKLRDAGALIAVSEAVLGAKHRHDLEYFKENVRVDYWN
jgi:hypothetical protein